MSEETSTWVNHEKKKNMDQLRALVRTAYMLQSQRVEAGNRMCAVYRSHIPPTEDEKEKAKEEAGIISQIQREHQMITEDMGIQLRNGRVRPTPNLKLPELNLVSSQLTWATADCFCKLLESERQAFKGIQLALREIPIYNTWLKDIKGVGPAMAGVICSTLDIHRAPYPSSFWAYAGYDVAKDGKARSRRKEHLVDRDYVNKDGKAATKKGVTYNTWLRQKLYVLAELFIKHRTPIYREVYDQYKHRLENSSNPVIKKKGEETIELTWATTTPAHRHMASMRYMIKRFLVDLHREWSIAEGLEPQKEYSEAKLGLEHGDRKAV